MLGRLVDFVAELRAVGVPVSMVEAVDAAEALRYVDLAEREALRAALGATLVKNHRHLAAFDVAFDVYFGAGPPTGSVLSAIVSDAGAPVEEPTADGAEELVEAILAALEGGDMEELRRLVATAVDRLSGLEPGRPVGGRYYFYRVMRRLDADSLRARLLEAALSPGDGGLDRRLTVDDVEALMETLRAAVRTEIVRRLIADRGANAVARTLRLPLVEDIDLMHATREELAQIERVVAPLARKLATRLAQRRKRGKRGRLDVRRTIRRSLSHGGALIDPRFRPPRPSKPELVLLCDVSGSMATFARFTMQLTHAIGNQFSRVRSFAFVDGIDEVTDYFGTSRDFHDAMLDLTANADLVWQDGHSDYGHAFEVFEERFGDAVTPRSTVIVTGDARNNYRRNGVQTLSNVVSGARGLFWLNPEARRYWNTGDSIMDDYAPLCDGVHEVRTLRQLERFIEVVALRSPTGRLRAAW